MYVYICIYLYIMGSILSERKASPLELSSTCCYHTQSLSMPRVFNGRV